MDELVMMHEAHSREAWQHTSCVAACILNASFHRSSRSQAVQPADLDPWALADREKAEAHPDNYLPIDCLIAAWTGKGNGERR